VPAPPVRLAEGTTLLGAVLAEDFTMPFDHLDDPDLVKLESDFQGALKSCPVTNIRGIPDPSAASIRRHLARKGWGHVIKTDDDIRDLAQRCGLDVYHYVTGGRAGGGATLIVRDPNDDH
jgi:hypothetical protein